MFHSKRVGRTSRRRPAVFNLASNRLENRVVMSQVNLTNVAFQPSGVQEVGSIPAGGAGWTVADVGDVNGDGFDAFVVGAPTVTGSGSTLALNTGTNSRAYLVFGSQQVSGNQAVPVVANFLNLTSNQWVGDLGTLGNNTQTNPTNPLASTTTALQFNGITFFTSQNPNSQLGASVTALGDINGDGFADFMIGAPGGFNINGANPGTGRAYIIYGGRALSNSISKTIDLDTASTDLTPVITLWSNTLTAGSNLGSSGAAGDLIVDNFRDVAVGAPNADPLGANGAPQANAGEVYVLSGSIFPTITASTDLNVDTVGQTGGLPGLIFTGNAGDQAGFSLAMVGDVSKSTVFSGQSDLLIGAPQGNGVGNGKAYFVNAQIRLDQQAAVVSTVNQITLSRVASGTNGTANTNNVLGAVFATGTSSNSGVALGYSVAAGGNLGTGTLSFMIGAPDLNNTSIPAVYLITGAPSGVYDVTQFATGTLGTQTPPATGLAPTTNITFTIFQGNAGDLAGFSETAVGDHAGASGVNDIAIGAPGENSGQGEVFWISRANNLTGDIIYPLSAVSQTTTTTQQGLIGATVIAPPDDTTNALNSSFASFTTTPAFLGASVSGIVRLPFQTGFTTDQDTIGDLVIGAPGYSLANYPLPTTQPIFSTSRTNAGSAFVILGGLLPGNALFTGTNTPVGGGGGGGGGGQSGSVFGAGSVLGPPPANLPLGSALIPTVASLSTYDSYQPLAESIAYAQFRPSAGWLLRMEVFSGKLSQKNPNLQRHVFSLPGHNGSGVHTLNNKVFTRDKYHPAKVVKFTHKVAVIPRNRQRNVYNG